jgi:hypothetical protein
VAAWELKQEALLATQGYWCWSIRDALCAGGPGGFWFGGAATPFIRWHVTKEDDDVCVYMLHTYIRILYIHILFVWYMLV